MDAEQASCVTCGSTQSLAQMQFYQGWQCPSCYAALGLYPFILRPDETIEYSYTREYPANYLEIAKKWGKP